MHKYEVIIYWSDEDELYLAEVPELPGCVTHGETYKIAAANAEEAIQLWIDAANEFGNPVPKPKERRFSPSHASSKHSQSERSRRPTALLPLRKNRPRFYNEAEAPKSRTMTNPRTR